MIRNPSISVIKKYGSNHLYLLLNILCTKHHSQHLYDKGILIKKQNQLDLSIKQP